MEKIENVKFYSPIEEKWNVVSHTVGLALSVFAFVLLVIHANLNGNVLHIVSFAIFGASLITLYALLQLFTTVQKTLKSEADYEFLTTLQFIF